MLIYHKQTTPVTWEYQSNPPTRWIGTAWSKALISARRPWALKGKTTRPSISDTQCLTLNRDRDYELPAVFNFSFSCVEMHISRMSMLTLVFAKEDSRYIWKLQCSDIMRPFWRKVLCFFRSYLALLMEKTYGYQLELLYSESGRCLAQSDL